MRSLITGASGFIGKRLALRLLGEGRGVIYLGRRPVAELDRQGAKFVQGDIADKAAVDRAMTGVQRVFHLAAWFEFGIDDPEKMERINVGGTRNVLVSALEHGMERVVYSSTTGIYHPTQGVVDERSPVSAAPVTHYTRTKVAAHAAAVELYSRGCPVVVALPGYVYGPDSDGPFGGSLRQLLAGQIPALVGAEQRSSYVHVDDVVEGLLLAEQHGTLGETYILAGEVMSFREWYRLVAEVSGTPVPSLELPPWLLYPVAAVSEWLGKLGGRPSIVSREVLDYLQGDMTASGARAAKELGWQSRPLRPAIAETIRWYQEHPAG
ncbi:NAD-dependent epimerase/dehydratase family protein [Gloeobacter violaceus]|nr:NAD-dependent epimerase/dehydratase family protein [Gloeobacter violaceus]